MKANVIDKVACQGQELSIGWAMQQTDPAAAVSRVFENVRNYSAQQIARARSAAAALIPSIVLLAQAALFVSFGFALMFIAAIIGG